MEGILIKNKVNKKDRIGLLLIIFILTWFSLEAVRNKVNFVIISVFYLIWLLSSIVRNPRFINRLIAETWPLLFWIMLILARSLIGVGELTSELIYAITLIMIYIIFSYYKDKNEKYKKIIFFTIIISYVITGIITIYYLNADINLVRRAAAGLLANEHYLSLYGSNVLFIGGWDYIYSLVGTTIVVFSVAIKSKSRVLKMLLFFAVILFTFIIFKASLSTAVLFFIFLIFMYFLPKRYDLKILICLAAMILLLALLPLMSTILEFAIRHIENENFIYKIEQALSLIRGEISLFKFYFRLELISNSLMTFLKYPITGIYGIYKYDHFLVSGHSQWIDDLARYGIISQCFFYFGTYKIVKRILSYSKNIKHRNLMKILITYIFIFGFLNPSLFIHIYLLVFLVGPFSSSITEK